MALGELLTSSSKGGGGGGGRDGRAGRIPLTTSKWNWTQLGL